MARFREHEASSSRSSPSRCCYHVFLSFRGEDTRRAFTDHLYTAFVEKGFPTLLDEEELERGEDIKPEFVNAIQQSRSSVIVFSKDCPSSRWCLDELVLILKQKRISDHVVLPVFYNIDPSHVRHQTGSVGEAFARHEENQQSPNKVKQWRAALREVADLAGMVLQNQANGYESKFVKQIVKVVDEKLSRLRTPFIVASYPIGIIDSRVKYINSWLNDGSADVVDENQKVNMHQMICDMGREIVRLESKEPEKRIRLWNDTDSFNGTETIEGLALDMHMHSVNTPWGDSDEIVFKTTAFARMSKLRLLHLSHVQFKGCYEEFPKGLRWLCWLEFPLKSLPSDLPLERLVYLEMPHSNMRQVFKGIKYLPSLKNVDLGHSHCLTEISNFSLVPNLESLVLEDCSSLVDVHESIGNLKRLVCLNLKGCKKIRKLPKNLFNLQSLDTLTLSGCSNLNEFWTELGKMKSLKVLDVAEIPISQVLMNTTGEVKPRIGRNPECLWSFLTRCLAHLNIRSCSLSDEAFPKDFGNLHSLEFLDLSRNPIRGLPHCVRGLRGLVRLIITQCYSLQTLEGLPRVTNFAVVDCGLLKRITFQSSLCVPIELLSVHNVKLVEIEYLYKFVPIARCDAETIKLLGLCNLKFKGITIRMLFPSRNSVFGDVIYKYHIQVLYEYGIISTFLPGNVVPGQFSHKNRGSCSISFTVPCSNLRIRGLNIFSVYTSYDGDLDPGYSCDKISPIVTKVHNKSTGMKWIYDPSLIGFPDLGEDMVFLSHWSLGNELKGGDQVIVSMFMRSSFRVNEWGIQLVHEQHQDQEKMMIMIAQQDDNAVPSFPSVVFGRLPEFEMIPRTYFLSNGPLSRRTLTFGHWKESDLFDDIFGDGDSHYSDEETGVYKLVLQQGVQNKIQKVEPRSRLRKYHMPFMLRVLHDDAFLASRAT
ncbi:hypothetical protein CerSpe_204780 [Prunus speciosa]